MTLRANRGRQSGFSLIELMIALLLGLLVAAAAGGVFISNKRVYTATETLGRIQENTRVAFEIMSRDLREAAGNPCTSTAILVNQMSTGGNDWWTSYAGGLRGYTGGDAMAGTTTGTGTADRVAGTESIDVHLTRLGDIRVNAHATSAAVLGVNSTTGLVAGDVLVACNLDYALIFQATALTGNSISHGTGGSSLNCATTFQFDNACDAVATDGYCFFPGAGPVNPSCARSGSNTPASVARVTTFRWYVGNNARGGTSLYRTELANRSATAVPDVVLSQVEIVEGVDDLELAYLEAGEATYGDAASVGDWARVMAVRVTLTLTGTEGALSARETQGVDGNTLSRVMTSVVMLRNRENLL